MYEILCTAANCVMHKEVQWSATVSSAIICVVTYSQNGSDTNIIANLVVM